MTSLGNYDSWLTTEPDRSDPRDDTRCPHNEDSPASCPTCTPDEEDEERAYWAEMAEKEEEE